MIALFISGALWLIGWFVILITGAAAGQKVKTDGACMPLYNNTMEDARAIFYTGLAYFLFTAACYYIDISFVRWAIVLGLAAFCVFPLVSFFMIDLKRVLAWKKSEAATGAVTGAIAVFVPIAMAVNTILLIL